MVRWFHLKFLQYYAQVSIEYDILSGFSDNLPSFVFVETQDYVKRLNLYIRKNTLIHLKNDLTNQGKDTNV